MADEYYAVWGGKKSDVYMLKQKDVQDILLSDKSKSQSNTHKMIHLYKNEYEHDMYKKKHMHSGRTENNKKLKIFLKTGAEEEGKGPFT